MKFPVYCDVKEIGIERIEQMIDDRIVEKMIAHREKKRFDDMISRRQQRSAVLFLPIEIFNEARTKAGRNQRFYLGDHALTFIANYEVESFDPRVGQCIQNVGNQGAT